MISRPDEKGAADSDDLAVRLQRESVCFVIVCVESGCYLAAGAERCIERTVRVVARQCEVKIADRDSISGNDDLPVRLNHNGLRPVYARAECGRQFPVGVETRVERAIGVVAGDGKVLDAVDAGIPGGDYFPVRLQRDGFAWSVICPESSCHFATGPEGSVERAVCVITGYGEIEKIAPMIVSPGNDDLAVRLHDHRSNFVMVCSDIGRYLAIGAKRRVEVLRARRTQVR